MKKILLLLTLISFFFSCEGPEGPVGPRGPQGTQGESGTSWKNISFTVYSTQWQPIYDNNGLFLHYQYIVNMPELNQNVYDNGFYSTFIQVTDNDNVPIQQPLPFVTYGEDNNLLWEQTVDCDYSIGNIAVYFKCNDFYDGVPGTMTFRTLLLWQ